MSEMIVVYDLFPEIAEKLDKMVTNAVNKAAFDIQAKAQANIRANGQVDTGFLFNSVYAKPGEEGDEANPHPYSANQEPEGGQQMFPEVEKPKHHEAIVAVAATYGIFQEFGTVHQNARPYLTPAIEAVRPEFIRALEKMEAKMSAL